MKKIISIIIAVLLITTVAVTSVGCGGGGQTFTGGVDDQGIAHVVFVGRDVDSERLNYQRVVDSFNASQKAIKVRMEWFNDGQSYNTMLDGLGKNLPDCLMLSNAMFLRYVSSGKLYDYKSRIVQEELDELYLDGYSAYCYDPATKQIGYSATAGLYGLPKDMGPIAIAYNKTLLTSAINQYNATAAGQTNPIDIDVVTSVTEPLKFAQFIDLGKKLKNYVGANKYFCSGYDLQSIVYSNNANYFTDDTAATAAIDSDNFVGAMQFVQDLYKNGLVPPAATVSSGGENLFTGGNSIFFYAGPWKTKDYWTAIGDSFEWDIMPVLCGDAEGAVSTCYVGGMGLCVSNNSPVRDYAVEFLKYVALNMDAQRSLYSNGQCIPNLKALANEYNTNSENLLANPEPAHRSVWIDCINNDGNKVSGKYRAEAYTYNELWYTYLSDFIHGTTGNYGSFWQQRNGAWVNIDQALSSFKPNLQQKLNEARQYL